MIRNKGKYKPFSLRDLGTPCGWKGRDEGQNDRPTSNTLINPPAFGHPLCQRGASHSERGFYRKDALGNVNCSVESHVCDLEKYWIPVFTGMTLSRIVIGVIAPVLLCVVLLNSAESIGATDTQGGLPQALFPGVIHASIATESEKPTSEAPAVISVITAEDLHNHGITSLEQALEEVPGVYSPFRFLNGNFVIRGVHTSPLTTPEVLLLVDGVPQHDVFASTLQFMITRIPVGNIKRIEIIRGPGSVIYGADAFAGVINVITKTDQDYEKSEVRGRVGSYDAQEFDAVLKGKLGDLSTLLSMQVRTTDGHRPLITEDAQTFFDSVYSTNASLAPGEADTYFDEYNVTLDVFGEFWRSRLQMRDHETGLGLGLFEALTKPGKGFGKFYNLDTFYDQPDWREDWRLKARINIFDSDIGSKKALLPAGAFGGLFPEGLLSDNDFSQQHLMMDVRAIYDGVAHHEIMFGAGYIHEELYNSRDANNFDLLPDGTFVLTPYLESLPDGLAVSNKSRQIRYLIAHDDWNMTHDIIFSIGARYDDYSDFGDTLNPRLALIWLTGHDITTKLIANRAFRAPLFFETDSSVLLFVLGNPDLDPTVLNTVEAVIEKRLFGGSQINLSTFFHTIKDNTEFPPPGPSGIKQAINSPDDITGNGAELEVIIPYNGGIKFKGSYSYQRSQREGNVTSTIFTAGPHHKVYAGVDWQFRRDWNLYTNILWVSDFTREVSDPRDDLGDVTFVGTVLSYTSPAKNWDTYLSIRNILDEEAVSPTNSYLLLPNDIPLPGTNFMAEIRYRM